MQAFCDFAETLGVTVVPELTLPSCAAPLAAAYPSLVLGPETGGGDAQVKGTLIQLYLRSAVLRIATLPFILPMPWYGPLTRHSGGDAQHSGEIVLKRGRGAALDAEGTDSCLLPHAHTLAFVTEIIDQVLYIQRKLLLYYTCISRQVSCRELIPAMNESLLFGLQ